MKGSTLRNPARSLVTAFAVAASVTLVGCGGSSGSSDNLAAPPATSCSVLEQNEIILEVMQDIYLWVDRMPDADPAAYSSPNAFLDALRVPEDRFSFLTSAAADQAFFGDGQFAGLGFQSTQTGADEVRLSDVFELSPAALGGLARGDRILSVNGRPIAEVLMEEGFVASLGPPEVGVTVELGWQNVDGDMFEFVFTKEVVTIPPVSPVNIVDTPGGRVGYFNFRAFVEPADSALNAVFREFLDSGVPELVVDLRYNSGGLLSIAEVLANLIGGLVTQGQILYTLQYNDANSFRDQTVPFRDTSNSLDLRRVVFITTRASASASEMVINGLSPFLDVGLIGATTFGKPVGQLGFLFCDKILRPVSFEVVNAAGEGDFFEGISPDCVAADDLDEPLGDPAEDSLAEALTFIQNGSCSAAAVAGPATSGASKSVLRDAGPWRVFRAH
jgi:C-terminal processing protease CtpA/Prc